MDAKFWIHLFSIILVCTLSLVLLCPVVVYHFDASIFEDSGVEILMRVYDSLGSGLILAGSAVGITVAFFGIFRLRRLQSASIFRPFNAVLVAIIITSNLMAAYLIDVPLAALHAVLATAVFAMFFVIPETRWIRENLQLSWLSMCFVFFLLVAGSFFLIDHVREGVHPGGSGKASLSSFVGELWWVGLTILAWWFALIALAKRVGNIPNQSKKATLFIGRFASCAILMPLLALGNLSLHQPSRSSNVTRILTAPNLYDVRIDRPGGQLLVTQTSPNERTVVQPYSAIFTVSLEDPESTPTQNWVSTSDFEIIALDVDNRELIHVGDGEFDGKGEIPLSVIVVDTETFLVKDSYSIDARCMSAVTPVFVRSADRLFVHCEEHDLFVVNLASRQVEKVIKLKKNVGILGDEKNGFLYLNFEWKKVLKAFDANALEFRYSAPAPLFSERMFLSSKQGKLYVPASIESEIWVYSVPDLRLLRKMPAPFGVRMVAVDEVNQLLIAASYVTGYVEIIDLNTEERVGRYFVGKYSRKLAVDAAQRLCFMTTTKEGLFLISY